MGEVIALALGGVWGVVKQAFAWLAKLPWYVIALAVLAVLLVLTYRHAEHVTRQRDAAQEQVAKDKAALAASTASIDALQASTKAQNAAVDLMRQQMLQARQAALQADAKAQAAAKDRDAAATRMRAAQGRKIPGDVVAPDEYQQAKGQF